MDKPQAETLVVYDFLKVIRYVAEKYRFDIYEKTSGQASSIWHWLVDSLEARTDKVFLLPLRYFGPDDSEEDNAPAEEKHIGKFLDCLREEFGVKDADSIQVYFR